MTRIHRLVVVALFAVFVLAVAMPAFAASHAEGTGDETTDTTVAVPVVSGGEEPAIVVPEPEIEAIEYPWTTRYLIPLLVITAIVIIVGVPIAYRHQIAGRYDVVR